MSSDRDTFCVVSMCKYKTVLLTSCLHKFLAPTAKPTFAVVVYDDLFSILNFHITYREVIAVDVNNYPGLDISFVTNKKSFVQANRLFLGYQHVF